MHRYEILIILNSNALNDVKTALGNEFHFLSKQKHFSTTYYGLVLKLGSRDKVFGQVNEPAVIPLAYEIKKQTKGIYVLYSFESDDTKGLQEFKNALLLNKNVLRYLLINLDNEYGAAALKNKHKAESSKIMHEKYSKRRDEFIKSKNAQNEGVNIEGMIDQLSDVESFDTKEKHIPVGDDLVVEDVAVVKKKRRVVAKKKDE